MTRKDAARLLASLSNAFPSVRLEPDTARLYLAELTDWQLPLAEKAVHSAIIACRFFPSVAELVEQYVIAREQAGRERREQERHEANSLLDRMPRPRLEEIPAARELLSRWEQPLNLPVADDGPCDDCGETSRRVEYGRFLVCRDCARSRLRAAEAVGA